MSVFSDLVRETVPFNQFAFIGLKRHRGVGLSETLKQVIHIHSSTPKRAIYFRFGVGPTKVHSDFTSSQDPGRGERKRREIALL